MLKMVIDTDVLVKACAEPLSNHRAFISETMDVFDVKSTQAEAKVFLSYARPDEKKVKKIYQRLKSEGFCPWMDTQDLLGGSDWDLEIEKAIKSTDFFLAFWSSNNIGRRSPLQREHRLALKKSEEMLPDDIFIIPMLLDPPDSSSVPAYLQRPTWIRKDKKNWYEELKRTLITETNRRIKGSVSPSPASIPFYICIDKGGEIFNSYEKEVGKSELYRNWYKTLRNLFDDSWCGNTHGVDTGGLGCVNRVQQVCIEVADSSSSELIYEGGDANVCNSCQPHSGCIGPHSLLRAGIPVFPANVAREQLQRLRERLAML